MASRPRSSLPKSRGRKLSDASIAESAPAVCRSGIFQFAPNQTFSNGCVESRGIFWCKSGSGEFEVGGVTFPIGPNDLFIAAHAYAHGATLVTANIGEFSRVRALKVENWLSDVH